MRKSSKPEKLIFVHVPKTAGATFRSILANNYVKKSSFYIHDLYPELSLDYLNKLSNESLNKYDLIAGHGTQYVLNRTENFKSIVFIRDPLKQVLSGYYHIKRSPHNPLYHSVKGLTNLHEYFDYLKENNGLNVQTMFLSREEQEFREKKRFIKIDENRYNKAIQLLGKIDYVFLTELFNESLYILKKDLGLNFLYYTNRNRTRKRHADEDHQELLTKIKEEQLWDYKLYQYARNRYLDMKKKFENEIEKEVALFTFQNNIYSFTFGRYLNIIHRIKGLISPRDEDSGWKSKPIYE